MPLGEISAGLAAAIAASGAVLGALVGATAGGVVEFWIDRRREARRAMVGARLVRTELARAAVLLSHGEQAGKLAAISVIDMNQWNEYREPISARLSAVDFQIVSGAMIAFSEFAAGIKTLAAEDPSHVITFTEEAQANTVNMRLRATGAFNSLSTLAQDAPLDPGVSLGDIVDGMFVDAGGLT